MNKVLMIVILIISTLACGPGGVEADVDGGSDTTNGEPIGYTWDETRCFEMSPGITSCAGRPRHSPDTWVMIVQSDKIENAVEAGSMILVDGWTDETCAPGKSPATFFPDTVCVWIVDHGASACYVGGDGWLTQATPTCDSKPGQTPAWSDWMCAGQASADVDPYPWALIMCSESDLSACIAVDGNSAMATWPTCWVDQWPAAEIPG
jgi:hypothetical protein